MIERITIDRALLERVLDALETGYYSSKEVAAGVHQSLQGYFPEKHKGVDKDVADIESAMTDLREALQTNQVLEKLDELKQKRPVKTYAGGKPNYVIEPECSTHADAPHGFDRNGSHNAGRYVCTCEGWRPDVEGYPV